MNVWMSLETQSDIVEKALPSMNQFEGKIKEIIEVRDWNISISSLDIIFIIMDDGSFDEIFNFNKKSKDMDFRIRIDYTEFLLANNEKVYELYLDALIKGLEILKTKLNDDNEIDTLICELTNHH